MSAPSIRRRQIYVCRRLEAVRGRPSRSNLRFSSSRIVLKSSRCDFGKIRSVGCGRLHCSEPLLLGFGPFSPLPSSYARAGRGRALSLSKGRTAPGMLLQYPLPACCLLIACSGVLVTIRILNEMRLDHSPSHAGFAYKTTEQLWHSRALLRCIVCSHDDAVLVPAERSFRLGGAAVARNCARASCTSSCADTRGLCVQQWFGW